MNFLKFPKEAERINISNVLSYSPSIQRGHHGTLKSNKVMYCILIVLKIGTPKNYKFESEKLRDLALINLDSLTALTILNPK